MRVLSFLLCCLLIVTACGPEKPDVVVPALPVSNELTAVSLNTLPDGLFLVNPIEILQVNDEYLVINDLHEEGLFKVFRLPEMTYLYTFGKIGRGPEEFPVFPGFVNVKQKEVITYDFALRQFRTFVVADSSFVLQKPPQALYFQGQFQPLNNLRRMSDSLYFANNEPPFDEKEEFLALKPGVDSILFKFGPYPETELTGMAKELKFNKYTSAKPDGSRFVSSYRGFNLFRIFDETGTMLKDIEIDDPYLPSKPSDIPANEKYMYRVDSYASDNYIYFLGIYSVFSGDKNLSIPNNSLEIWSWEGKPLFRAYLDRRLPAFTVSEKLGTIYGLEWEPGYEIVTYDISDILKDLETKK